MAPGPNRVRHTVSVPPEPVLLVAACAGPRAAVCAACTTRRLRCPAPAASCSVTPCAGELGQSCCPPAAGVPATGAVSQRWAGRSMPAVSFAGPAGRSGWEWWRCPFGPQRWPRGSPDPRRTRQPCQNPCGGSARPDAQPPACAARRAAAARAAQYGLARSAGAVRQQRHFPCVLYRASHGPLLLDGQPGHAPAANLAAV